ncbi:protein fantom isoform X2 [Corythoichthys intestinalis]|uniref:protein fantom isoform X2 n=1 Tax=Corythoichthys intestinalis TaxID=161448 RepID=UPI0025A67142|nr:protein fantom isoform X2 [Corythoichthys intestinalis]
MSFLLEETEAVVNPLRSAAHDARVRADVSRVSRKELEDNFLQLHDDSLLLKQHIHQQEDKIRKLGTKLLRLVKDRRRMERLAEGGLPPASSRRDSEKEDLLGEFQEKLRALEADNERLRQRLFVAERRRRLASAARSPRQRVSRKPDDASSPSPTPPRRARSLPGDERPPTAQPAASAYALLEEAREKNRNLENAVESQRRRIAQLEEEKNVTLQQQNKSELRSQINNNVTMIKLQKQLAERCDAMSELEERFLQLQESQQTQKACYDAAAAKMAELTSQLKDERAKGVELRTQLQTEQLVRAEMRQLRERVEEAEQERDLLKEHNDKLLSGMLDGRPSAEERHLERQVARLEAALQADLRDKETILEQVRAERDAGEKLREEKRQLEVQLVEERRRTERLRRRGDSPADDGRTLARATPEVPQEFPPPADSVTPAAVGDIYTETVQELEKVRRLLAAESRVSANLKAELESIHEKMERDKKWRARQPEARPQMLAGDDAWEHAEGSAGRAAEWERAAGGIDGAAARERAPKGAGHPATREDAPESCVRTTAREYAPLGAGHPAARERTAEDAGRSPSPPADKGENLVEFQIVGAALSPAALEVLGDPSPSTFCTYAFYLYELHATPVATGASPRYGFTSRYAVSANRRFLNYLRHGRLRVELHQALGLRGKTLASAALELRGLLRDGAAAGALPLLGSGGRDANFGRLDYWIKLRHPIEESDGAVDRSVAVEQALRVEVRGCEGLRSERAWPPSPYVVYKLLDFPDQPTSTARDTRRPRFGHVRTFALSPSGAQERRLASEALTFYVFDYKEPRTDAYLGKAAVPLAPLLSRGELAGTFDLRDSSGRHAGRIDVALEFSRNGDFPPEAEPSSPTPDETLGSRERRVTFRGAPSPDRRVAKKVTFPDAPPPDPQKPAEEGEEDEESSISEGQLVLTRRTSDPAEEARSLPLGGDAARGRHSPSDDEGDDVVRRRATQDSRRFRVEVASLSLDAESRLCADADVVRLFVEFAFLDMPTEETPVSLPKPPPGKSVSFNFSKVVPVDSKRRLLREVLGGLKPDMERIRFTVVSEPPEEQEQERDCEDVGVAYLKIGDLLSQADDVASLHLPVVDVIDGVSPLGVLAVSFEGVRTLRLIRDEADAEARSAGA